MQADTVTCYLAQLLVTRLAEKEALCVGKRAMFTCDHLRRPLLGALDTAWRSLIAVRSHLPTLCVT